MENLQYINFGLDIEDSSICKSDIQDVAASLQPARVFPAAPLQLLCNLLAASLKDPARLRKSSRNLLEVSFRVSCNHPPPPCSLPAPPTLFFFCLFKSPAYRKRLGTSKELFGNFLENNGGTFREPLRNFRPVSVYTAL